MKVLVTLDIEQADEDEVRLYLNHLKKQMEKYTNIRMADVKTLKDNKKAPFAEGAITKLPPRL